MTARIENVADLLATVSSGRLSDLSPSDMEVWLPRVAATTSWRTGLSRHFLLLYHAEPGVIPIDLDAFLANCEEIYGQVAHFFGNNGCNLSTVAAGRHLSMLVIHARSPLTFGSVTGTDTLLYLLDTIQDPDYLSRFRHEISHFVWGVHHGEAPGLLNEGVAVVSENMSQPGRSEEALFRDMPPLDQVPPLSELCHNDSFFAKGTANYKAAGTLVRFFAERLGWSRLGQLFQASSFDDPGISDRLSLAFGLPLEDIDREWRAFCKNKVSGRRAMKDLG